MTERGALWFASLPEREAGIMTFVRESTLDDLLRRALEHIRQAGSANTPSRGQTMELVGAHFELENPLARLRACQ